MDSLSSSMDNEYLLSLNHYNKLVTTIPAKRVKKEGWLNTHNRHKTLASKFNSNLVLIGDSIVAGFSRYKDIWSNYFKIHSTLNLGIGGDRTQHILWRCQNLNLPLSVKRIILYCGSNNIDSDPAKDIANGIMSIALIKHEKHREVNIYITG